MWFVAVFATGFVTGFATGFMMGFMMGFATVFGLRDASDSHATLELWGLDRFGRPFRRFDGKFAWKRV